MGLMKENGIKLAKERSRRCPAQTITDVDYADAIALLANTPTQAESLLHAWNEQQVASMPTHTRENTCALIKEVTSPH